MKQRVEKGTSGTDTAKRERRRTATRIEKDIRKEQRKGVVICGE